MAELSLDELSQLSISELLDRMGRHKINCPRPFHRGCQEFRVLGAILREREIVFHTWQPPTLEELRRELEPVERGPA